MNDHKWYCLDHNGACELDSHGRCSHCGSNGVAPESYRSPFTPPRPTRPTYPAVAYV
jgi:hypothetical protein